MKFSFNYVQPHYYPTHTRMIAKQYTCCCSASMRTLIRRFGKHFWSLFHIRYSELSKKISKSRRKSTILSHTQRKKKLLVHERLKLLLDDESFLELSPLAGFDMPYGDVPAGGCITGKFCIRHDWPRSSKNWSPQVINFPKLPILGIRGNSRCR